MITVTYTDAYIDVDFGDAYLSPKIDEKQIRLRRDSIISISNRDSYVQVGVASSTSLIQCNLDGSNNKLPITKVNDVTPVDIDNLYDLLKPLIS